MPYIALGSAIRPAEKEPFPPTPTFIDCYADFDEQGGREIQAAMENLGGSYYFSKGGRTGQASLWWVLFIPQPHHFVPNGKAAA